MATAMMPNAVFARHKSDKDEAQKSVATATADVEEDAFGNIMHTGYEKFNSVTFTPPAAGATCTVTADIATVGYEDEDVTPLVNAYLIYSVNSGPETTVHMRYPGKPRNIWTGEIPGQATGTNVRFHIRATDSFGNTTSGASPSADRLAEAVPDMDNSSDIVPDDLDIIDLAAGYDQDHIYVRFSVQGKISGGTLDPPYIHFYGIKITNPDIDKNEGLMVGNMWMIIPQLKLTPKKVYQRPLERIRKYLQDSQEYDPKNEIDKITATGMVAFNLSKGFSDHWEKGLLWGAEPEGKIDGSVFSGRINRKIMGRNPSGLIRLIIITVANVDRDHLTSLIPLNNSHYLNLYLSDYSYTIK